MKSWRYVKHLFLLVFLNTINLSKEACHDLFEIPEWVLNDTFSLVRTKDPKDTMKCTLESECLKKKGMACHILSDCFDRETPVTISEKCKGGNPLDSQLYYYHFRCLAAKAFNYTPNGCNYDTVCKLYSEMSPPVIDQTPLPVTTTLPEATTATTLSPSTTKAELPPTTGTLAPTITQTAVSRNAGQTAKDEADSSVLKISLIVSVILNVILAFGLYMRQKCRQDKTQWNSTHMLNGKSPGDQPMAELKLDTSSANGNEEATHLMQPCECHSVLTHVNCWAVAE